MIHQMWCDTDIKWCSSIFLDSKNDESMIFCFAKYYWFDHAIYHLYLLVIIHLHMSIFISQWRSILKLSSLSGRISISLNFGMIYSTFPSNFTYILDSSSLSFSQGSSLCRNIILQPNSVCIFLVKQISYTKRLLYVDHLF